MALAPARAWVSFGWGGAWLDPTYGERWFVERLRAAGVQCDDPYQWYDINRIVHEILQTPKDFKIFVFGDSLGACEAPNIGKYLLGHRIVDGMGGFQPSIWGEHIPVTANVMEAICLYDPSAIVTLGLGAYRWVKAPGNTTTNLQYIPKVAPHPDDNDIPVQNRFLDMVKRHRMGPLSPVGYPVAA